MALYVALAAWSYSAALADDIETAAITIFFAWLISVCAFAFGSARRPYLILSFALVMAGVSGLLFYYFYHHRPSPPYVEGARLVVAADPPMKTANGNYYFTVSIHDIGDRPVDAYADGFFQQSYPAPLDLNGENAFMELSEAIVDQAVRASNFNSTGSDLTTKTAKRLINYGAEVTPAQIEAMKSGPFYFYEGVTIVFTDENAKRENVLYYAEGCRPLFEVGIFEEVRNHVIAVPSAEIGEKLALTFEKDLGELSGPFYATIERGKTSLDDLDKFARIGLPRSKRREASVNSRKTFYFIFKRRFPPTS
jgi:hypothetical protein